MERSNDGDFGWRGMNTRVEPERLPPGYASYISNMFPTNEGVLQVRPGWRGLLTTAQGDPIYGLSHYRVGNVHRLFWVGGNVSTGFKLFAMENTGSTTATDVTGGISVTAGPGVHTARWGSFIYGVDGVNAMFRWNGTTWTPTNAEAVSNLNAPGSNKVPTIKLESSSTLVSDLKTTANYSQPFAMDTGNYFPPNGLVTEPNFDTSSGTTITGQWNADAGQPTIKSANTLSGNVQYVELDSFGASNAKEYVLTDAITCPDDSAGTGAKLYYVRVETWAKNAGATPQVLSTQVQLFDGSSVQISGTNDAQYSNVLSNTKVTSVTHVFDYRSITTDPNTVKLRLGAPNAETGSGGNGVNVNRVNLEAPEQKFRLITTGDTLLVQRGSVLGFNGILYTQGLRIYNTGISNQNWSGKQSVYFDMAVSSNVTYMNLRFLIRSVTTWYAGGTLFPDPAGGFVADLSQFSSAVLSDVDGFGFEFTDDTTIDALRDGISWSGPFGNRVYLEADGLFSLKGIKDGGNLSNGYTYTYRFSEWDGTSITTTTYESTDGRESSGSPISADVTTTAGQRQAVVTIPEKTNVTTDQFLVWREGGVYDDGKYRLVGVVSAPGSGSTTFTDNVSDATLFDRPIYQIGRDSFPTGLSAIAVHQGRLWAAKGNTVYVSWVLNEGQETGVYTTLVPDPDDPYLGIKGASFTLDSSGNKDDIKALVPMGTVMLAIREYSVSVISGYDSSNFAAQPYLQGNNAGMVGGTAAVVRGRAWFMSALGVMEFNGDNTEWVSQDVENSLIARSTNPQIEFFNDRAFVFNDSAADSSGIGNGQNGQVHIYDYRTNGWYQWTTPGTGTSSALAIGNVRRTSLFSGSRDGQVYILNFEDGATAITYGDRTTPSAATSAVSFEIRTRAYGQFNNYGATRFGRGRLMQVDVDAIGTPIGFPATTGVSTTFDVLNSSGNVLATRTFAVPIVRNPYSFRGFLPSAKAVTHRVRATGSASTYVALHGIYSYFSESEVPRARV